MMRNLVHKKAKEFIYQLKYIKFIDIYIILCISRMHNVIQEMESHKSMTTTGQNCICAQQCEIL